MDKDKNIKRYKYLKLLFAVLFILQTIILFDAYCMVYDTIFNRHRETFFVIPAAIVFALLPFFQLIIITKLFKQFNRKNIILFFIFQGINYLWYFVYLIVGLGSVKMC